MQPGASNLLGVLVTQIAHVMARSDELAVCANCKKLFRVKRRLSRGSRRYCPRCRRAKVPQRDAYSRLEAKSFLEGGVGRRLEVQYVDSSRPDIFRSLDTF